MALGRISGPMLVSNLLRDGVDLAFETNLLYLDVTNGFIGVGNSAPGHKLSVTGDTYLGNLEIAGTSLIIPVGNISERPSPQVTGMLRVNPESFQLEFYDSIKWQTLYEETVVITSDVFVGNGNANTYVLSQNSTTNGSIVSFNGQVQLPTTAYTVLGNLITFAANVPNSTVVEVREITTTAAFNELASDDTYDTVVTSSGIGISFYTGISSRNERWRINTAGHFYPIDDNSYDIGIDSTNQIRSLYWGSQLLGGDGNAAVPAIARAVNGNTGIYWTSSYVTNFAANGVYVGDFSTGGLAVDPGSVIGWRSTGEGSALDTSLDRNGAGIIAQRSGTTAQSYYLFNTYSGGDYERFITSWSGNQLLLKTQQAGLGVAREILIGTSGLANVYLQTNNTSRWYIGDTGNLLAASDGTYDIGLSSSYRPRDIYITGNLIADGNANVASLNATNIYGTLGTNAQPYITSTGILTGLTVNGNILITGGGDITGLPAVPTDITSATSKSYVDALVAAGTVWKDPISDPDIQDVATSVPSPSGAVGDTFTYIAYGGSYPQTWGTLTDVAEGDVVQFIVTSAPSTGTWSYVQHGLVAGDRYGIAFEHGDIGSTLYTAGFRKNDLLQYVSGDPSTFAAWATPSDAGFQVINFTTAKISSDVTALVNGVTYDLNVSIDGTNHNVTVTADASYTFGELATDLTTALDAVYTGASAILELEGHIHLYSGDETKVIISEGTGANPLLAGLSTDFDEILAGNHNGTTVLVNNPDSLHYRHTYLYTEVANNWVEIAGPGSIGAGTGLAYSGDTLNVQLGAGITELPTDEIGIDLYDTNNNPLILTSDGTNRSNVTGAQLGLLLDGTTLTKSSSGLKVSDTYPGNTSLVTLGNITTGTWSANIVSGEYGGTGVANTNKTITIGGNLTTSGSFDTTFTIQGTTALTLPTSGTVVVTSNNLSVFASTTSSQLAGIISDETGTGNLVFNTSPTISTPIITGGSINNTVIGNATANTGAFTTLTATSVTVSSLTSLTSAGDINLARGTPGAALNWTTGGAGADARLIVATGSKYTFSLDGGSTTPMVFYSNAQLSVSGGIGSTSTTTGTIVVAGGQGISGNLYVGGILSTTGNISGGNISATSITGTLLTASQPNITGVGILSSGTWQANIIAGQYGGTGVANTNKTITIGGNLTTSGAFTTTLTMTANTTVTLPTSGTLATTGNLSQFAATTSAQLAGVISDETGTGNLVFNTTPTISSPVISGGSINNTTVGATTRTTGAFTTLLASGQVTANAGTSSTSTGTGTIVITGGLGASGNINIGGTLTLESTMRLQQDTSRYGTTGLRAYQSATNGAGVFTIMPNGTSTVTDFRLYNTGDGGNTGAFSISQSNSTVTIQGSSFGTGAGPTTLTIGSGTFTSVGITPATTLSSTLDVGSTVTATRFISNIATGTAPFTVSSTTLVGNLNVSQLLGSTWVAPGAIGSTTRNTGAFTTLLASGQVTANVGTNSTSTSTGAIVVTGGIGVSGNIYSGGILSVTGNISGGNISATSITGTLLTASQPNITGVGTLSSGTWHANIIAGQYGGTGVANTNKTITIGGNLTTSGAFTTTLTMTANTTVTFPTSGTLATTGNLSQFAATTSAQLAGVISDETGSGNLVFNNTPTISSPVISGGSINNTTVGATTRSTGAFTTLLASGQVTANVGTNSTSTSTGAIVVTGGIGVSGNIYLGGRVQASSGIQNTPIGNVTANTGAFTTISASGQVTSTVSTGTAPLVIASTTKVTNLNADLLDGFNSNTGNVVSTIVVRDSAANVTANNFVGTATSALYSDLAENYRADQFYLPGTVLEFGGKNEVTIASEYSTKVAGVVSTAPAHLMNVGMSGEYIIPLALQGRVPCKVTGKIFKGDMLISAGNGLARAEFDPKLGSVIGKSLEDFDGEYGMIEVVVGRV